MGLVDRVTAGGLLADRGLGDAAGCSSAERGSAWKLAARNTQRSGWSRAWRAGRDTGSSNREFQLVIAVPESTAPRKAHRAGGRVGGGARVSSSRTTSRRRLRGSPGQAHRQPRARQAVGPGSRYSPPKPAPGPGPGRGHAGAGGHGNAPSNIPPRTGAEHTSNRVRGHDVRCPVPGTSGPPGGRPGAGFVPHTAAPRAAALSSQFQGAGIPPCPRRCDHIGRARPPPRPGVAFQAAGQPRTASRFPRTLRAHRDGHHAPAAAASGRHRGGLARVQSSREGQGDRAAPGSGTATEENGFWTPAERAAGTRGLPQVGEGGPQERPSFVRAGRLAKPSPG